MAGGVGTAAGNSEARPRRVRQARVMKAAGCSYKML